MDSLTLAGHFPVALARPAILDGSRNFITIAEGDFHVFLVSLHEPCAHHVVVAFRQLLLGTSAALQFFHATAGVGSQVHHSHTRLRWSAILGLKTRPGYHDGL